jgi:hypothetical protein
LHFIAIGSAYVSGFGAARNLKNDLEECVGLSSRNWIEFENCPIKIGVERKAMLGNPT